MASSKNLPTRTLNWTTLFLFTAAAIGIGLALKYVFKSDYWELAGFVTGVVGVYLAAIEHIFNWPIGIVNVLVYAWVFYTGKLFADMSLQGFYFVLLIQGWWLWARGGPGKAPLEISRIKPKSWLIIAAIWVGGTAIYYLVDKHFGGQFAFVDSTLTVASMIGQIMLNKKKIENWMIWIVVDTAYIPVYISKGYQATALLYFFFLVLAIVGLATWTRHSKTSVIRPVGRV